MKLPPVSLFRLWLVHSAFALSLTVAGSGVSAADLTLSWTDNSDNESGFRIDRSIDGQSFSEVATVGVDTETYTDTGLIPDTFYWYRVHAYNSTGESGFSNTAFATTGSGSGSSLEVVLASPADGAIFEIGDSVTVTAEVSGASEIDRVELLIDGAVIGQDTSAPFIFLWSGAEAGVHTVQLRAVDSGVDSVSSDLITVTFDDPSQPNDPPPPGVYRGTFSTVVTGADEGPVPYGEGQDTGRFSIWVDADGSMRFLGFEASTGAVFSVSDAAIASDGSFVVSGSSDGTSIVVRGRISAKGIEGLVDGREIVLTGSSVDEDGPSGSAIGVYEAFGVRTSDTSVMAIVGGDGLGFLTVLRNGVLRAAEVPVQVTAEGAYLASDALKAELTVDFETGSIRGTMTVEENREIWLMGIRSDVAALRRLENISTRATISGEGVMITGFVVSGTESKDVLIRAIGPGLGIFGVSNSARDPVLKLVSDGGTIATNSRWTVSNVGSIIETVTARVGAFPLDPESLDACLLVTVSPGRYSALVSDAAGSGGNILIEIYDASALESSGNDMINLSTRGSVGSGAYLVGGFVVSGNTPKRVLIRGIGPGLGDYGVSGALEETRLVLAQRVEGEEVVIGENSGWASQSNADGIVEATASAGAFALNPGNLDSALLMWIEPGVYTATVQPGSTGLSGTALVEVYQVD